MGGIVGKCCLGAGSKTLGSSAFAEEQARLCGSASDPIPVTREALADEMLGRTAPFRRDMLLYDIEQQDPVIVQRRLAEMQASRKALPASGARGRVACDPDLVRRQLGFVPSWVEIFSQLGAQTRALFSKDVRETAEATDPHTLYALCALCALWRRRVRLEVAR